MGQGMLKSHTSSEVVTAFREDHGEPDVIEIRKTFSNADDAKDWEHRILQRMNVVKEDKWLNGNDKLGPPLLTGEKSPMYGRTGEKNPMYGKTGEKNPNYGKTPSEETKKKMSEGMMGEKNPMYGRTGEKSPMYGRTGEKHPLYGRTGEKSVTAKKIKVTYLGIEKIYSYMGLAVKDLSISAPTLSFIATGKTKKSRKYPGLRAEYI